MVESIKMAVMASPTTPMVVSCPVAFRNSEKYWLTSCSMVGTKFLSRKSSICPLTLLKTGKAEKIARPMANSGTMAISEV